MKLKNIRLVKKSILLLFLILLAVILRVMQTNAFIAEYIFARGASRAFVCFFGNINNLFPVSIFELFIVFVVIFAIIYCIYIIKTIKKRNAHKLVKLLLNLGVFVLIFINIYTLAVSGNYYRDKAPINAYQGEQLSKDETVSVINYFLDDYNEISNNLRYDAQGKSISPYSYKEITTLLCLEFSKLSLDYGNFYNKFNPKPKKAMFSFIMSYEGVTGIAFLPTGEATINYQTPKCQQIVTIAHEMAHIKGVMMERQANMIAYYVLINSDIPYFRYCGYMYGLSHLTSLLYYYDSTLYAEVLSFYPQKASKELQLEREFWDRDKDFIDKLSNFFNDLYLKLNGVGDGVNSYNDSSFITPIIKDEEPTIIYSDTVRMLIALYPLPH